MAPALLLTHSGDFFTVDRVLAALKRRGQPALRIDTDRLGIDWHLDDLVLHGPRRVDLSRVKALWARRLWFRSPEWLQPFERVPRWVNPLAAERAAESKLTQLALAKKLGLSTPATLFTDRPDKVRTFRRRHGRIITKLLYPTVQSMQADPAFVYTTEVEGELTLDRPQLFQPLLLKEREVRLVAVGSKLFSASIDPRTSKTGWLDWRKVQPQDGLKWRPEPVPSAIAARVKKMMRALGLVYGAFDFLVMPKRRWVFLEVNPAGEYGWLERDLGLPISDAIAAELS